jgi:hypothetical protein
VEQLQGGAAQVEQREEEGFRIHYRCHYRTRGGSVATAVLHRPINEHVIPWLLDWTGQHEILELYLPQADGSFLLDGRYKILVPLFLASSSGRMIELLDKPLGSTSAQTVAASEQPPADEPAPLQFVIHSNTNAGVRTFSFAPISDTVGGGAFAGDSSRYNGVYVRRLVGVGHATGEKCHLSTTTRSEQPCEECSMSSA